MHPTHAIRIVGFIDPALTAASFGLLLAVAAIGVVRAGRRRNSVTRPMVVGLLMWAVATAYLTLLPGHAGRLNLVPFDFGASATPLEPLSNVLLFIPLGILLATLNWRWFAVVGVGLGLSLMIETTQYLLDNGRTADVNDVMENTLGTVIGLLVALAIHRMASRREAVGV